MASVLPAPGLSAREAAERPRGIVRLAWSVLREPMILLLLAAAAISFLLAEPIDALIPGWPRWPGSRPIGGFAAGEPDRAQARPLR